MPSDINRLIIFDRFFEKVHRRILNALKPAGSAIVLDAGCGTGGFARLMARKLKGKGRVVALDVANEILLKGRGTAAMEKIDGRILSSLGDIEQLPFPDQRFDLVWCSRVAHHHLPDPEAALAEMIRVLRPGGRLAVREDGGRRWWFSSRDLEIDEGFQTRLHDLYDRWFKEAHGRDRPDDAWWMEILKNLDLERIEALRFPFTGPEMKTQLAFLDDWLRSFLFRDASGKYRAQLPPTDRWALKRLTDPELECCILNQEVRRITFDYETTVYVGVKP